MKKVMKLLSAILAVALILGTTPLGLGGMAYADTTTQTESGSIKIDTTNGKATNITEANLLYYSGTNETPEETIHGDWSKLFNGVVTDDDATDITRQTFLVIDLGAAYSIARIKAYFPNGGTGNSMVGVSNNPVPRPNNAETFCTVLRSNGSVQSGVPIIDSDIVSTEKENYVEVGSVKPIGNNASDDGKYRYVIIQNWSAATVFNEVEIYIDPSEIPEGDYTITTQDGITAAVATANEGNVVTLSGDFAKNSIFVTDETGVNANVIYNDDGTASFAMPASSVNVTGLVNTDEVEYVVPETFERVRAEGQTDNRNYYINANLALGVTFDIPEGAYLGTKLHFIRANSGSPSLTNVYDQTASGFSYQNGDGYIAQYDGRTQTGLELGSIPSSGTYRMLLAYDSTVTSTTGNDYYVIGPVDNDGNTQADRVPQNVDQLPYLELTKDNSWSTVAEQFTGELPDYNIVWYKPSNDSDGATWNYNPDTGIMTIQSEESAAASDVLYGVAATIKGIEPNTKYTITYEEITNITEYVSNGVYVRSDTCYTDIATTAASDSMSAVTNNAEGMNPTPVRNNGELGKIHTSEVTDTEWETQTHEWTSGSRVLESDETLVAKFIFYLRGSKGSVQIRNLRITSVGEAEEPATPPTAAPTATPTLAPTATPTLSPTATPTLAPTATPTLAPTATPTLAPTATPTAAPTATPTAAPTATPTAAPTATPTAAPTATPTAAPTATPTLAPTATPTLAPTATPTLAPTATPTLAPTATPTLAPTATPTLAPTATPTLAPTAEPTAEPTTEPEPTAAPVRVPEVAAGSSNVAIDEGNGEVAEDPIGFTMIKTDDADVLALQSLFEDSSDPNKVADGYSYAITNVEPSAEGERTEPIVLNNINLQPGAYNLYYLGDNAETGLVTLSNDGEVPLVSLYINDDTEPAAQFPANGTSISQNDDNTVQQQVYQTQLILTEPLEDATFTFDNPGSQYYLPNFYGFAVLSTEQASAAAVKFVKASEDDNTLYNIVIATNDSNAINRLSSADLTFELDNQNVAYQVLPYGNVNISTDPAYPNRYLFNFNGEDQKDDSGREIIIGQIQFYGYGAIKFGVSDVDTNVVHAATTIDNIVTDFVVDGSASDDPTKGDLDIGERIDTTLEEPKHNLQVTVTFNNAISENDHVYQQMQAKISGGNLSEPLVYNFGDGEDECIGLVDGNVYSFDVDLLANATYTVEISGKGYRTARHTVTLNENKILNFWNNVMDEDNAMVIETTAGGEPIGTPVVKNFLAGDIVKNNKIDIYDLSAVVSYFGEIDLLETKNYEYAKYDLNRDGKIDSKDVAMVLVSWGE